MKFWLATKCYLFFLKGKPDNIGVQDIMASYVILGMTGQLLVYSLPADYAELKIIILILGLLFFLKKFLDAFYKEIFILAVITYILMIIYTVTIHAYYDFYYILEQKEFNATIMGVTEKQALVVNTSEKYVFGHKQTLAAKANMRLFNIRSSKEINLNHAIDFYQNKNDFVADKSLFEGGQKYRLVRKVLAYNELNKNVTPLKIMFTHDKLNLQPFIEKGGDAIIIQGKNLICVELKYRQAPFLADETLSQYLDELIMRYGRKQIISIDCNSIEIYCELLNYVKEKSDAFNEFFCFSREKLVNPSEEIIRELEQLPLKQKYFNIALQDVSYLHEVMTQADVDALSNALEAASEGIDINKYKQLRGHFLGKIITAKSAYKFGNIEQSAILYNEVINTSDTLINYENSQNIFTLTKYER